MLGDPPHPPWFSSVADLHLKRDPSNYFYLSQSSVVNVSTIDDAADWREMMEAFTVMNIDDKELMDMLKVRARERRERVSMSGLGCPGSCRVPATPKGAS